MALQRLGIPVDLLIIRKIKEIMFLGKIIGPQIFTAGSLLNSPAVPIPFVEKKVNSVFGVEDEINNQANTGVDFVKLYVGLNT